LEILLANIEQNYAGGSASPHVLYGMLIQSSNTLAQATVENTLQDASSRTIQFAGIALSKLMSDDHAYGITVARKFIEADSHELHAAVGRAYCALDLKDDGYAEEDLALLRGVLSSKEQWVVRNGVGAVRTVAQNNKPLAIDLLKSVDIGISSKVADEVLILFQRDEMIPFRLLTDADIAYFLNKLMPIPELDGYWIETFLSEVSRYHAQRAATFFMERVEHAASTDDWHYRPCNHGPYLHVPLRFRETEEFSSLLRQVSQWMKSHPGKGYQFKHRAAELFNVMFNPLDDELLGFIQDWIDESTPDDMRIISQVLSESGPDFVFEQRIFVARFMDKAKQQGKEVLENAASALYSSAISGLKSGIPGEPFPKDIKMRDDAENALQAIPRFAPARRLYESLKKSAEADINRSLRERETFEDE
jgi:hypothetical protein